MPKKRAHAHTSPRRHLMWWQEKERKNKSEYVVTFTFVNICKVLGLAMLLSRHLSPMAAAVRLPQNACTNWQLLWVAWFKPTTKQQQRSWLFFIFAICNFVDDPINSDRISVLANKLFAAFNGDTHEHIKTPVGSLNSMKWNVCVFITCNKCFMLFDCAAAAAATASEMRPSFSYSHKH